jgi:hypothetical protein
VCPTCSPRQAPPLAGIAQSSPDLITRIPTLEAVPRTARGAKARRAERSEAVLGAVCRGAPPQETPGVAARDAQLALAALAALTGPARHGAARALAELAEAYGHDDVAQILDEWLDDRPDAT